MTLSDVSAAGAADAPTLLETYVVLRPTLLRIFAARLRSAEAAEDLVQELYLRVRRTPSSEAVDAPRAWLFRAASNLMIDRRRGQVRTGLRDGAWQASQIDVSEAQGAASPERIAAGRQALIRALEVVDALPPRMGQAFRLTRIEGLTHAQVGARMGLSTKAVEKHVAAALGRLTAEMKGLWP